MHELAKSGIGLAVCVGAYPAFMTKTYQNSGNRSELLLFLRFVFSHRHFIFILSITLDVKSERKDTLYFSPAGKILVFKIHTAFFKGLS